MSEIALYFQRIGASLQSRLAALVGSSLFWALFVALGLIVPVARSLRIALPKPLPSLSSVPDFTFADQNGERFGTAQLRGKIWIANAVFTRCPTVCPVSTQHMSEVQHRGRGLGEYLHLVSFSVDPEHDTPEVLNAYAKSHRVSPRIWTFLTGDREELKRILNQGLKIYMGKEDEGGDDLMSIGHGSHFVLVDTQMRIRGYYDLSSNGAVDSLLRDAGLLASRGE
jgi:protein SCO1/2